MTQVRGIIFDVDRTLVDSNDAHAYAWVEAMAEQGYHVSFETLRFERFNGQMSEPVRRLVFERGDAAAALLWNRDMQKVILIKQFRYPTYKKGPGWLWEVVAGIVDQGEQPQETIRREVREEVGYQVDDLHPIATFYVSPGSSSERIALYYAEVGEADVLLSTKILSRWNSRCLSSGQPCTRGT